MSDDSEYKVLINNEDQYSLWSSDLDIPNGWYEKYHGSKESCLDYINKHWVDMRPKSLRDLDKPQ